jgi:hypothetical protein
MSKVYSDSTLSRLKETKYNLTGIRISQGLSYLQGAFARVLRAVGSAPASSSSLTIFGLPRRTARCRGVPQFSEVVLGSRPLARRNLAMSSCRGTRGPTAANSRSESSLARVREAAQAAMCLPHGLPTMARTTGGTPPGPDRLGSAPRESNLRAHAGLVRRLLGGVSLSPISSTSKTDTYEKEARR